MLHSRPLSLSSREHSHPAVTVDSWKPGGHERSVTYTMLVINDTIYSWFYQFKTLSGEDSVCYRFIHGHPVFWVSCSGAKWASLDQCTVPETDSFLCPYSTTGIWNICPGYTLNLVARRFLRLHLYTATRLDDTCDTTLLKERSSSYSFEGVPTAGQI